MRQNAPIIISVTLDNSWPYPYGGGHCMNISGQRPAGNSVEYQIVDPYITIADKKRTYPDGKYWMSLEDVYIGTVNHPDHKVFYY